MNEQTGAAAAPGFEEQLSSHQTMVLAWRSGASKDSANAGHHPSTAPLGHQLAVDIGGVADAHHRSRRVGGDRVVSALHRYSANRVAGLLEITAAGRAAG